MEDGRPPFDLLGAAAVSLAPLDGPSVPEGGGYLDRVPQNRLRPAPTLENILGTRAVVRLRCPAQFKQPPETFREPRPEGGMFTLHYLHENSQVCVFMER